MNADEIAMEPGRNGPMNLEKSGHDVRRPIRVAASWVLAALALVMVDSAICNGGSQDPLLAPGEQALVGSYTLDNVLLAPGKLVNLPNSHELFRDVGDTLEQAAQKGLLNATQLTVLKRQDCAMTILADHSFVITNLPSADLTQTFSVNGTWSMEVYHVFDAHGYRISLKCAGYKGPPLRAKFFAADKPNPPILEIFSGDGTKNPVMFRVAKTSSQAGSRGSGSGLAIPRTWARRGVVLERHKGDKDHGVSGDPCIVWDDAIQGWRMVLFYDPPGHAQAVCTNRDDLGPGQWKFEGPLPVVNPQAVGGFHKPFIVMAPDNSNRAAKIDGRYCLLVVSFKDGHKQVQRAWSEKLAGPWTFDPEAIIPRGVEDDFDAKHTDAVTGYYFPERKEFLYFYMGYPAKRQGRQISPFGSAQAVATQKLGEKVATKRGVILEPCQQPGHWASGWVGGLQLLRGTNHRWVAVVNASPTAPDPGTKAEWTEEPPPSLGGFAWCDEEWPTSGWHFSAEPIEWVKDIPKAALDAGEGYNLWRQFIHILPDGRAALFYNSGYYGREQLYLKVSDKP